MHMYLLLFYFKSLANGYDHHLCFELTVHTGDQADYMSLP